MMFVWNKNRINMKKIILIDFSIFIHKAIFAQVNIKKLSATYLAMNMIMACLKKLPITPDDILILARDSFGKGNWRRKLDENYKADRKVKRRKKDIDWDFWFPEFNRFTENLSYSTSLQPILVDNCEADDIISSSSRHFKDNECIIVSSDSDFEPLTVLPNVKLFSNITKDYKYIKNPYKILADKITKEKADNLVTKVTTEEEYEIRKKLVNLLELPKDIDNKIIKEIKNIDSKYEFDIDKLWHRDLAKRYNQIYENKGVINYGEKTKAKKRKKGRKVTKKS